MDDLLRESKRGSAFVAVPPPSMTGANSLVCLNFKIPMRVRQQFKIYAARNNMTMTELLIQLLEERLQLDSIRNKNYSENAE